jgi:TonB family protein
MPLPPQTKEAKEANFQGTILVEGVVTPEGRISSARIVKSPGLGMNEAILKKIKTWKCNPGIGPQGKPLPMLVQFELNFRLN